MIFQMLLGHAGHEGHDLLAGLIHPFTGMDHPLAMVAIGLWASKLGRRGRGALPLGAIGSVVLAFAIVHGLGHFAQIHPGGPVAEFGIGLIFGSAALVAVGAALGRFLRARTWNAAPTWCGATLALLAVAIAVITRV